MTFRVGISGWTYGPWRGKFYPEGLAQKRELEFASRQFNTIEINGSFYSLQRPESYRAWVAATPDGFVFAVKGGRYITHMRKLKEPEQALANFFASGVLALGARLGPILWQLPPQLGFDADRMAAFLALLPHDEKTAARLARKHAGWMRGRTVTRADGSGRLRHAVEVRHPSFADADFVRLLRRHNVALVFADSAQKFPYAEDVTADFVYVRLHGAEELYASGYTDGALDWWAARLKKWAAGAEPADATRWGPKARKRKRRDVYVYFDNDAKVKAPFDALNLAKRLGIKKDSTAGDAANAEARRA